MKGKTPMAKEQILILEDDLTAMNLVSKQLTAAGYEVIPVVEGWQAVQTCLTKQPALVVCDIKMPGMDGIEFIRKLREVGFNVPIVVISAAGPAQGEKALAAGANAYLPKPVDRKLLISTVRKEIIEPSTPPLRTRKHVLAVEDEPMDQRFLRATLEPAGYLVISVESSTAALDSVEKDPPDMVVCDIVVPGMDGVQLVTTLRRACRYRRPILVVSGHAEEKYRQAMLDAGADAFAAKPVAPSELLARVEGLLSGSTRGY